MRSGHKARSGPSVHRGRRAIAETKVNKVLLAPKEIKASQASEGKWVTLARKDSKARRVMLAREARRARRARKATRVPGVCRANKAHRAIQALKGFKVREVRLDLEACKG